MLCFFREAYRGRFVDAMRGHMKVPQLERTLSGRDLMMVRSTTHVAPPKIVCHMVLNERLLMWWQRPSMAGGLQVDQSAEPRAAANSVRRAGGGGGTERAFFIGGSE